MDKDENGRFLPGNQCGSGRPKGSRNKLSDVFIKVLAEDFEADGVEAIKRLREENPAQYANVIAKLMPKLTFEGEMDKEQFRLFIGDD